MFEFVIGLFAGVLAAGSFWFWLVLIAIGIALVALVENEKGTWATFTAIGTVLLLNYAWKVPVFKVAVQHPFALLAWVGVYYAAGAVWGMVKWASFVHNKVGLYNDYKADFLKNEGVTELTPALAAKLQERIGSRYNSSGISSTVPTASEHKSDIVRWMTYWPFSIIGTFLSDFVVKLWNHIYTYMAKTYDRIAARLFKGVSADMAMAEQYKADLETKKAADQANDAPAQRRR